MKLFRKIDFFKMMANPVINKFGQLFFCSVGRPKSGRKTTENRQKPPKTAQNTTKTRPNLYKKRAGGSKAVYNRYKKQTFSTRMKIYLGNPYGWLVGVWEGMNLG